MPQVDPAILQALSLDDKNATLTSHGGSNFTGTFKLSTKDENGEEKYYFVKIGKGEESKVMFAGEDLSLTLLHATNPALCPRSISHGPLTSSPGKHFLLTTFLVPSPPASHYLSPTNCLSQKLALLHSTPAPIPPGLSTPQFGFPLPTCCGSTIQNNTYRSSWADFYAECRIGHIFSQIEGKYGGDNELEGLVQTIIESVIPRLLGKGYLLSPEGEEIVPVLVHGDLWGGNWGTFVLPSSFSSNPPSSTSNNENEGEREEGQVEEMLFDPSSCYAHSEYEFGIMHMFGGFGSTFEKEYWGVKGKDRPVEEWGDRVRLYELYHHLNHYLMFGGSYKGSAMRIMNSLIEKYGGA